MANWLRVSDNRASMFNPLPAIFPSELAPVMRLAPDGERELVQTASSNIRAPSGRNATNRPQRKTRSLRGGSEIVLPVSSLAQTVVAKPGLENGCRQLMAGP